MQKKRAVAQLMVLLVAIKEQNGNHELASKYNFRYIYRTDIKSEI
jgi:hypothetical protein